MTHAIFIRTYHRDAEFLGYLLCSLQKFATGFDAIVVNCDHADERVIQPIVGDRARLVLTSPSLSRGYLVQQVSKLNADLLCMTDHVTFIDSDCIAYRDFTPETFQRAGKGEILVTPFDHLGSTVPWRPATEAAMGERVEFECMRAIRLQYRADTIRGFREWMIRKHGPLHRFIDRTPNFSEFCALGAWAFKHHYDRYYWLNTEKEPLPTNHPLEQVYSGNGLTPEIRARWDGYLA